MAGTTRGGCLKNPSECPFSFAGPGKIEPGSRPSGLIQNIDYTPTFLEMAKIDMPEGTKVQGRSFVPLMQGQDKGWQKSLYYTYYEYGSTESHNIRHASHYTS